MRVNYSPAAFAELKEITKYYQAARPGLAEQFVAELNTLILRCCDNPDMGLQIEGKFRRLVMRRFPFNIIYRRLEQEILVVAVAHQHRKPGYWQSRLAGHRIGEAAQGYMGAV